MGVKTWIRTLVERPGSPYIVSPQPPYESSPGRRVQATLGIDYGTLFTKAVIGIGGFHYAVSIGRDNSYIVPSRHYRSNDDAISLQSRSQVLCEQKMKLLTGSWDQDTCVEIASYLSLVIRGCIQWFNRKLSPTYKGLDIEWVINIGLPTESYENVELTEVVKQIVRTAWACAISPQLTTVTHVRAIWNVASATTVNLPDQLGVLKQFLLARDSVNVFPEFVAQVTGYTRTPARRDDLHLLIDVGGGTLDATVFNIYRVDGEERFSIFARAVINYGTRFLQSHRESQLGKQMEGDQFSDVPAQAELASLLGIPITRVRESDSEFMERPVACVWSQLRETKSKRYPTSRKWDVGVPTFLCGGGAAVDAYQAMVTQLNSPQSKLLLSRNNLPKPENFIAPGLMDRDFDRMLVAYGLSFDPFDIGAIIEKSKISDIDPEEHSRPWRDNYPDRDVVE